MLTSKVVEVSLGIITAGILVAILYTTQNIWAFLLAFLAGLFMYFAGVIAQKRISKAEANNDTSGTTRVTENS